MPLEDTSMSKYSEIYEDNHDGGELYCLKYEGSHIYDVIAWIERRDETIEIQAAALESQSNEIAALQTANKELLQQLESERETAGRRFNALRRISEILQDNDASSRTKLGSIGFVVKEALKALSLFDWSEASNEETQQAEQLALGLEAPDSAKGSGE
jgi:hypothetical protein